MLGMIEYINEIKRQFRDVYGFQPIAERGGDLIFSENAIPDGEYPMTIKGKLDHVRLVDGKINCCNFDEGDGT